MRTRNEYSAFVTTRARSSVELASSKRAFGDLDSKPAQARGRIDLNE